MLSVQKCLKNYVVELGKRTLFVKVPIFTIVTYGMMVHTSVKAAEELEKQGIKVEVIDLRTISPIDIDTVVASVKKTNRAIVVQELKERRYCS